MIIVIISMVPIGMLTHIHKCLIMLYDLNKHAQ